MRRVALIFFWSTVFCLLSAFPIFADHLTAGEIQIRQPNCSQLTFEIILTLYVNTNSNVLVGGDDDILDFGDGQHIRVPELGAVVFDPELEVGRVIFKISHTYQGPGSYVVSYSEPNRDSRTINAASAVNTRFYVESKLVAQLGVCNSTPQLSIAPIDRGCTGLAFYHNPGASDGDEDSLSFELAIPKRNKVDPVFEYRFPNHESFYVQAGIPYINGNEAQNGPPIFKIDPVDGTLLWDSPAMAGVYVLALKINEWKFRKADSTWYQAGYVIRDMQIFVEDCDNLRPGLSGVRDFCVMAGETINLHLTASDPNNHFVAIEAFSEILQLEDNSATMSPASGTIQATSDPSNPATIDFSWVTSCDHARNQRYQLVFKISDRPTSGPRLIRFYIANITVVAPPVRYEHVTVNPVTKSVQIDWEYPCADISGFQIWRRTSQYLYEQPGCSSGMPVALHYQLLGELPGDRFSFTDNDLAIGAMYCYRVVALVGARRTRSRLSIDTCLIPRPAEAPVIVSASILSTASENGEVLVRWTRPFDIDANQYPPPYHYRVLRKTIDQLASEFVPISNVISDTAFVDHSNTANMAHSYKVELYVPALTTSPVDTSSQASTVFLATAPLPNAIELTWEAETPWFNYSELYPWHLIYRSATEHGPFLVVDSVNVIEDGFRYVDVITSADLQDFYYYRIETRGTYGNPKISSPLKNWSQSRLGLVLDTIPPCTPVLAINADDCHLFDCNATNYFNTLEWTNVEDDCNNDAIAYEVVIQQEEAFVPVAVVSTNSFKDTDLADREKCYKVIAFDRAGNKSDTSNIACGYNCVNIALPNIITPGLSEGKNDTFTLFAEADESGRDCSRAVESISMEVFSRQGKRIYVSETATSESASLWNGMNNLGDQVSAGIYYYKAIVIFRTSHPRNKIREVKGWIHVIQ